MRGLRRRNYHCTGVAAPLDAIDRTIARRVIFFGHHHHFTPSDSVALFTTLGNLKRVFRSIARGMRRQAAEVATLVCQKIFTVEEARVASRWNTGSKLCGLPALRQLHFIHQKIDPRSATEIRMRSPVLTKARGPPLS
jgi:hypothetical protein